MARRKLLFSLFFVFFADEFGLDIMYPLITSIIFCPEYGFFDAATTFAQKNLLIGSILSVFPFAQYFGVVLFGRIADRIGRKKALYITTLGSVCGFLFSGIAAQLHSYPLLFASRVVTGFFASNTLVCFAALADISTTEKERARHFSSIGFIAGACWLVATLVGGVMSQERYGGNLSAAAPFYIAAIIVLCSTLFLLCFFEETFTPVQKPRLGFFSGWLEGFKRSRKKNLWPFASAFFFWFLAWVITLEWFAPTAVQRFAADPTSIAFAFCAAAVTWSLGNSFCNRMLLKRFSVYQVTVMSLAGFLAFAFCMPFGNGFWQMSCLFSLSGIFASMSWSNLLNLISLQSGDDEQGVTMGIGMSMQSLAWICGPLLGAYFTNKGVISIYWIVVLCGALGLAALFRGVLVRSTE